MGVNARTTLAAVLLMALILPANAMLAMGRLSTETSGEGLEDSSFEGLLPDLIVPDNYTRIQDAIDSADDGDVILVRPGTYQERLSLWKKVALVGSGFANTLIVGSSYGPAVEISASGAEIRGFVIAGGEDGIRVRPSSTGPAQVQDVTVQGMKLTSISNQGIRADYCMGCQILSNVASGSRVGIVFQGGADSEISFNRLDANMIGIDVSGIDNWVAHNAVFDGIDGIEVTDSSGGVVEFNSLVGESRDSIRIVNSSNVAITSNRVSGELEGSNGIILVGSRGISLTNNLITGTTGAGVRLIQSSNNFLKQTKTLGNDVGVWLQLSSENQVVETRAIGNFQGILLDASDKNIVLDNLVKNSQTGITVLGSRFNSLSNNLITQNEVGMLLDYSDSISLEANYFQNNTVGLQSRGSSNVLLHDSMLFLNTRGVHLEQSGSFTIQENLVIQNSLGIAFYSSTSLSRVFHNLIIRNGQQALTDGVAAWDDGVGEGNFWSDYGGKDMNGDGVGDTSHMGLDQYPLVTLSYVESKPAKELMKDLRADVLALPLRKTLISGLLAELDTSQASFYKNNVGSALKGLRAFVRNIKALVSNGQLDPKTGEDLVSKANMITMAYQQSDSDFDDLSYEKEKQLGTNPVRVDTDDDGMPDAWETVNSLDPLNANDSSSDIDSDGLSNLDEYLVFTYRMEFAGVQWSSANSVVVQYIEHFIIPGAELCYVCVFIDGFHSLPLAEDSDGDGLEDRVELLDEVGTDPRDWDTDDDHMSDAWEVRYGFDPTLTCRGGGAAERRCMEESDADDDGDSISNRYEYWLTQMFPRLDINYITMDPFVKDLVVEVDWVPDFDPDWDSIRAVQSQFNNHMINLHIIRGEELDPAFSDLEVYGGNEADDFWRERTAIDHCDEPHEDECRSWAGLTRFAISVDDLDDDTADHSGVAAHGGDTFVIAHAADAGWVVLILEADSECQGGFVETTAEVAVAGTFMHELGHSMGLSHAGDHDVNCSDEPNPNYNSVMNYRFQRFGVDVDGDTIGDGATEPADEVVNYSDGTHGEGDFDDWTEVTDNLALTIVHYAF